MLDPDYRVHTFHKYPLTILPCLNLSIFKFRCLISWCLIWISGFMLSTTTAPFHFTLPRYQISYLILILAKYFDQILPPCCSTLPDFMCVILIAGSKLCLPSLLILPLHKSCLLIFIALPWFLRCWILISGNIPCSNPPSFLYSLSLI